MLLAILLCPMTFAQVPERGADWVITGFEDVKDIAATPDGDCYVMTREGHGLTLWKYNEIGKRIWKHDYWDVDDEDAYGEAITSDPDGNAFTLGYYYYDGESYLQIMKVSPGGTVLWHDEYESPYAHDTGGDEVAKDIVCDTNGNVYASARCSSSTHESLYDIVVMKYTPGGTRSWLTRFNAGVDESSHYGAGGNWQDTAIAVDDIRSNVYVACEHRVSHVPYTDEQMILLQFDAASGALQWQRTHDDNNNYDYYTSVAVGPTGDVYATGGDTLRYTALGSSVWTYTSGNAYIDADGDGNAYIISSDVRKLAETDGTLSWSGTNIRSGVGARLAVDPDTNIIAVGSRNLSTAERGAVVWYDRAGNTLYTGEVASVMRINDLSMDGRGNSFASAYMTNFGKYAFMRFDFDGFAPWLIPRIVYAREPGDQIWYDVVVKNGEDPVTGVELSTYIPTNTFLVGATGSYTLDGSKLTWTYPSLGSWERRTNMLTVQISHAMPSGAIIVDWAEATHDALPTTFTSDFQLVLFAITNVLREAVLGDHQDVPITTDPVHPGIGNYIFTHEYFRLPSRSLPVVFGVYYNSLDNQYTGAMGYGWTHTYGTEVTFTNEIVTDTLIARVKWGDGRVESFRRETNDAFTSFGCMTKFTFSEESSGHGWKAALSNGVEYLFDTNGWLTTIDDGHSRSVTFTRETSGRLTQLTDTRGRAVNFHYTNDFLASVSLPFAGYSVGFGYDNASNLTSITDMRGNTRYLTYDNDHRLTSDTDPRGILVISNRYDAVGRVVEQVDVEGESTFYSYNTNYPSARVHTEITGPAGLTVSHDYDYAFNVQNVVDPNSKSASFSYDENGNRTHIMNKKGDSLSIKYDALNNPTSVVNALGAVSTAAYDSSGRPTVATDPLGNTTTLSYDGSKRLSQMIDGAGSITKFYYTDNDAPDTCNWIRDSRNYDWYIDFNADEQAARIYDPKFNYVGMTYDSMGRLASCSVPGLPSEKSYLYYDAHGNVTSRIDSAGSETRYTYDANDNLLSSTFVPATSTVTYAYDRMNRVTNSTDALGGHTTYAYDQEGRLAAVTDPDGVRVTMDYDDAGRLLSNTDAGGRKTSYGYDACGQITAKTNHLGVSWHYEYDALGHLSAFEGPDGHRSTVVYDLLGRPSETTDELGRTTYRQYDGVGRVTNVIASDGGMTSYKYDGNGNLTEFTTPTTQTWQFTYDKNNLLVTTENPLGQTSTYSYDARGNRTGKTDRDGGVYSYTYNLRDQMTSLTLPGAGGIVSNVYDGAGNLVEISHNGMTWSATYDKAGRITSFTDANTNTLGYTYSPGGRLSTTTYPGGKTVTNVYDAIGRLAFVRDWAGNETAFTYDSLNRPDKVTLPNGTTRSFSYNANNRMTEMAHERADTSVLHSYSFGYNAVGQITSRVEESVGVFGSFSNEAASANYNAMDRLVTTTRGGVTNRYWYDPRGNLVSNSVNGTMASFTYDALNRLIASSNGSTSVQYTYDPNGRIIARSVNGTPYHYLGDGRRTYAKLDGNNNVMSYYIHAGPLAYSLDAANDLLVYHLDERGSVTEITDDGETVAQSYAYSPYGRVIGSSGTLTNEFQFIGGYGVMREEDGFSQMGARFYDPDAGRFMSEDPIGLTAGANLYAYVQSDPINEVDPSGLANWIQDWIHNKEIINALDIWWEEGHALRDAGYLTVNAPVEVLGTSIELSPELIEEYVFYSYTDAEKDARIIQDFAEVDKLQRVDPVMSQIKQAPTTYTLTTGNASPWGNSNPKPPPSIVTKLVRGGKSYFKDLYRGLREDARILWGLVSAEAYGLSILGNMEVSFILAEGGTSIAGTTIGVVVVDGVVFYVVTDEVLEYTGLKDEATKDKALAWQILSTQDNLINEDAFNRYKWKEMERLNQKIQSIDDLIKKLSSTPGYNALMTLENPNYQ